MKILYFFLFLLTIQSYGQQISLYDQFNGNYDYTAIGATLNTEENNDSDAPSSCIINTSASAKWGVPLKSLSSFCRLNE